KTLMASPKTVKLSSADQARVQRWSASNADLKAWHMTGDVTDDQLIERMTALAERIANAVRAKDIATLRKLADGATDDEEANEEEVELATAAGRQAAIKACPGRNDIERACYFLAHSPVTSKAFAELPMRLQPLAAGRFLNRGQLSDWDKEDAR